MCELKLHERQIVKRIIHYLFPLTTEGLCAIHTQTLMVPSDCPCLSTILVFLVDLYNVSISLSSCFAVTFSSEVDIQLDGF